jgi:hypothetical protein
MLAIVSSCVQIRALLFLVELLGLAAGLAIVLGHNLWSSGLPALIITLIGWLTLIRSIILLFLSPEAIGRFIKAVCGTSRTITSLRLFRCWLGFI